MLGMFVGMVAIFFLEVVNAGAGVAFFAHGHQVGELVGVAGGLPDHRVHQDRTIQTDNVVTHLDDGLPPGVADVALQLRTQRAVVVATGQSAVNFTGLVDESTPFTQGHDVVKLVQFRHKSFS